MYIKLSTLCVQSESLCMAMHVCAFYEVRTILQLQSLCIINSLSISVVVSNIFALVLAHFPPISC